MAGQLQTIASLALILAAVCLLSSFFVAAEEDDFDDLPVSKLSSNAGVPTLKFYYWYFNISFFLNLAFTNFVY